MVYSNKSFNSILREKNQTALIIPAVKLVKKKTPF